MLFAHAVHDPDCHDMIKHAYCYLVANLRLWREVRTQMFYEKQSKREHKNEARREKRLMKKLDEQTKMIGLEAGPKGGEAELSARSDRTKPRQTEPDRTKLDESGSDRMGPD